LPSPFEAAPVSFAVVDGLAVGPALLPVATTLSLEFADVFFAAVADLMAGLAASRETTPADFFVALPPSAPRLLADFLAAVGLAIGFFAVSLEADPDEALFFDLTMAATN
jgi:hypothetical protein